MRTATPPPLNRAERDRLIEQHVGYARSIAAKAKQNVGGAIDFDELVAFGTQGLVEAADRFDPARGIAFTTFSYYRIKGAIYDGLRKLGWLGRGDYARFQARSNDLLANFAERGTPARSIDDAANDLAITLDQVATVFVTSLEAQIHDPPSDAPDGPTMVARRERASAVRSAMASLPQKERALVQLCYFEDLSLTEAGARLGLSKSWASRLHARAIRSLGEVLGPAFAGEP